MTLENAVINNGGLKQYASRTVDRSVSLFTSVSVVSGEYPPVTTNHLVFLQITSS